MLESRQMRLCFEREKHKPIKIPLVLFHKSASRQRVASSTKSTSSKFARFVPTSDVHRTRYLVAVDVNAMTGEGGMGTGINE